MGGGGLLRALRKKKKNDLDKDGTEKRGGSRNCTHPSKEPCSEGGGAQQSPWGTEKGSKRQKVRVERKTNVIEKKRKNQKKKPNWKSWGTEKRYNQANTFLLSKKKRGREMEWHQDSFLFRGARPRPAKAGDTTEPGIPGTTKKKTSLKAKKGRGVGRLNKKNRLMKIPKREKGKEWVGGMRPE